VVHLPEQEVRVDEPVVECGGHPSLRARARCEARVEAVGLATALDPERELEGLGRRGRLPQKRGRVPGRIQGEGGQRMTPERALEARERDRAHHAPRVGRRCCALELAPLERARVQVGEQDAVRSGCGRGEVEDAQLGFERVADGHERIGRGLGAARGGEQQAQGPQPVPPHGSDPRAPHRVAC